MTEPVDLSSEFYEALGRCLVGAALSARMMGHTSIWSTHTHYVHRANLTSDAARFVHDVFTVPVDDLVEAWFPGELEHGLLRTRLAQIAEMRDA